MPEQDGLAGAVPIETPHANGRAFLEPLDTPGQRIKFMREKVKGWSQDTLASKVHATQPAVSQWENDRWLPSRQSQFLLAEALGTTRTFLFGEAVA